MILKVNPKKYFKIKKFFVEANNNYNKIKFK